jgi:DNA-binding HxlR family transcriptional regulator
MPDKAASFTNAKRSPRDRRAKVDPWNPSCPSREMIGLIASKWVCLLMPLLRHGPRRNGDLMRGIPGISQKMLTQTLRILEANRLIARHDFKEIPPRVEYRLTHLGASLCEILTSLDGWVIDHYYDMSNARGPRDAASPHGAPT